MNGQLYLCATPIGNLEDISFRILEVLKSVDLIAAEDTRHSMRLLNHYDIHTSLTSYHEFNKIDKAYYLVEQLKAGKNIALISDAGTPGISDPGEELVKFCVAANINVTALPGPVACITALTLSGLSTRRFVFEGFLPKDKKERAFVLETMEKETRTMILYEAPHRLLKTLKVLADTLGDRHVALCKELTKKFENIDRLTLNQALETYQGKDIKGEYVIVIEGLNKAVLEQEKKEHWEQMSIEEHMDIYLCQGMNQKEAMKAVATDRKVSKRDIYNYLVQKSDEES